MRAVIAPGEPAVDATHIQICDTGPVFVHYKDPSTKRTDAICVPEELAALYRDAVTPAALDVWAAIRRARPPAGAAEGAD